MNKGFWNVSTFLDKDRVYSFWDQDNPDAVLQYLTHCVTSKIRKACRVKIHPFIIKMKQFVTK